RTSRAPPTRRSSDLANEAIASEEQGGPTGIDHAKKATIDYIAAIYPGGAPPALPVSDPAHIPASYKLSSDSSTLRAAKEEVYRSDRKSTRLNSSHQI